MKHDRPDARSIAAQIMGQVDSVADQITHGSLFSRLILDRLGLAIREGDGVLSGEGRYMVYYAPVEDWTTANQNQTIGEWVYGEWSTRPVEKVLDSGEVITGSRLVVALGRATKAGNGTGVSFSRVGVGLVQRAEGLPKFVHFVAAVNMMGLRAVSGPCEEHEFYSSISGFITNRQDNITIAQYPLPHKKGGIA